MLWGKEEEEKEDEHTFASSASDCTKPRLGSLLLLLLAPPLLPATAMALLGNLTLVIAPCLAPEKRATLGDRPDSMVRTSTMPAAAQANPAATSAVLPSCRVLLGLENTSSSITTIPVLDTLASERSGSGTSGNLASLLLWCFFGVSGQKLLASPSLPLPRAITGVGPASA
jgi:hypothetical protein